MGRFSSPDLYEEAYPSEATRAAKPSRPSYSDDGCDLAPTRSPRESYAALSSLDSDDVATRFARPSAHAIADSDEVATRYNGRSSFADSDDAATRARPPAQAFVAPAEIEGDRSPAMRARRQSYVAPSERPSERPRSYVAPSERPVPAPPRPSRSELDRRSRASYVASSERNDFASSVPDGDEVTSFREPAPRKSHVAKAESVDGVYSSSEIEELKAPASVDFNQLRSYLFDDISEEQRASLPPAPHKTTNPLKTTNPAFPPPPHPSSFLPPPPHPSSFLPPSPHPSSFLPPSPKATHPSFAPPAPAPFVPQTQPSAYAQQRPMQVPAASASSSTPVAPLLPRPHMRSVMNAPAPHDSYVDSSWIVPTPAYPQPSPVRAESGFRFSLSFLAAAITAAAALIVMIGAVIFVRSDEVSISAQTFAMHAATPTATADEPAAAQPLPAPAQTETAPAAPPVKTVAAKDLPKDKAPVATAKPKKKIAAPVASNDDQEDDTPAPAPKPAAKTPAKKTASAPKLGDKTVEQMLADLGEEQLRR